MALLDRTCHICDGHLQRPNEPMKYSGVHKVWACPECYDILKSVPPMPQTPTEATNGTQVL